MAERGWSRYSLEGGTIVLSILLALFFDAAWDDYQDGVREQGYLTGLSAEFREGQRELASDQQRREQILDVAGRVLRVESGATDAPSHPAPSELTILLDYRFYTPSHPFLEDLISSGSLHLIESRALRLALLNYQQEKDRLQIAEQRERDFVADQLEPYVAPRVALNELLNADAASVTGLPALWRDPAFVSLVWIRWGRTETSLRFGGALERAIEQVQSALDRARRDEV